MSQDTAPQQEYKITVNNSRSNSMCLGIEPEGWFWEMAPGEAIEIIFEKQGDFWQSEPIVFTDEGVTFWGAVRPSFVFLITGEERHELYPQ